jgi:hypothetical protein
MNKAMLIKLLVTILLTGCNAAFAADDFSFIQAGQPYSDVRQTLMDKGWTPIKNVNIDRTSLYAQEVYAMGLTEVTDCISMEIDGCTFLYRKGKQRLEIKTITRQLSVESLRTYRKNAR